MDFVTVGDVYACRESGDAGRIVGDTLACEIVHRSIGIQPVDTDILHPCTVEFVDAEKVGLEPSAAFGSAASVRKHVAGAYTQTQILTFGDINGHKHVLQHENIVLASHISRKGRILTGSEILVIINIHPVILHVVIGEQACSAGIVW